MKSTKQNKIHTKKTVQRPKKVFNTHNRMFFLKKKLVKELKNDANVHNISQKLKITEKNGKQENKKKFRGLVQKT